MQKQNTNMINETDTISNPRPPPPPRSPPPDTALITSSSWVRKTTIGRGSFGTVSLAVNRHDNRVFAVKSVHHNSTSSAHHLHSLENEISILRTLSSPHVVAYLGDDITMEHSSVLRNLHLEYLPGGTAADGPYAEGTVRQLTRCLTAALRYIHSKGIVHCDVKGRNVLLGSDPGTAKLADFGSARRVLVTQPDGQVPPRGSPLWMAPELIRGESQGFESDVWSLGCTVIEMITGKPAWDDQGAETLLKIGCSNELPKFQTRLSQLGQDFIEKCLRREPDRRWSCDQLLQHPFLYNSTAPSTLIESTPRSILDYAHLDLSVEDEEDEEEETGRPLPESDSPAERVCKLAMTGEAIWESEEGWVEVRRVGTVGSDYLDLIPAELDRGRAILESECSTTWVDSGGRDVRAAVGEGIESATVPASLRRKWNDVEILFLLFFCKLLLISFSWYTKYTNYSKNCNNRRIQCSLWYFLWIIFDHHYTHMLMKFNFPNLNTSPTHESKRRSKCILTKKRDKTTIHSVEK